MLLGWMNINWARAWVPLPDRERHEFGIDLHCPGEARDGRATSAKGCRVARASSWLGLVGCLVGHR